MSGIRVLAWYSGLLTFSVPLAGSAADSGHAQQTDQEIVRRVAEDWRARQEAVRAVRYVATGTVTVPRGAQNATMAVLGGSANDSPGSAGEDYPAQDVVFESRRVWLVDFQRGLIRKEAQEHLWDVPAKRFNPVHRIVVFDGDTVTEHRPQNGGRGVNRVFQYRETANTPEYILYSPDRKSKMVSLCEITDVPVYLAHGIVMPERFPQGVGTPVDLSEFRVYQKTRSSEGVWGRVVLRKVRRPATTRRPALIDQFDVDLTRGSALLRHATYAGEKPGRDVEIQYQRTDVGWLPQGWVVTTYDPSGKVTLSEECRIVELTIDPRADDSQFTFDLPPGAVAQDDHGRHFRVRDDGSLDRFEPFERTGSSAWQAFPMGRLIALGAIVAVAATVVVLRLRRKT